VVVHRDCHVQFARAYYSAPFALAGKTLWLRATDAAVALYQDYRHLYTHLRARRPGERMTNAEHLPPDARAFYRHDRRWCHERALAIGPHCAQLIDHLLSDRIAERLRAAQSVIALAQRYGAQRVEAACQRAIAHDSPYYVTVKTMLATGADLAPIASVETPGSYQHTRFTRSAADLFSNAPATTTLQ
jgi:hypothetical protein